MIRRIKFWRKFCNLFPHYNDWFLQQIALESRHKYTPTGSFRRSFLDVGWKCLPHGRMQHAQGFILDWFSASLGFVRKVLIKAWTYFIMDQVRHRNYADMQTFNSCMQQRLFRARPAQQQGILVTYIALVSILQMISFLKFTLNNLHCVHFAMINWTVDFTDFCIAPSCKPCDNQIFQRSSGSVCNQRLLGILALHPLVINFYCIECNQIMTVFLLQCLLSIALHYMFSRMALRSIKIIGI